MSADVVAMVSFPDKPQTGREFAVAADPRRRFAAIGVNHVDATTWRVSRPETAMSRAPFHFVQDVGRSPKKGREYSVLAIPPYRVGAAERMQEA
jgi:hypothetical protein